MGGGPGLGSMPGGPGLGSMPGGPGLGSMPGGPGLGSMPGGPLGSPFSSAVIITVSTDGKGSRSTLAVNITTPVMV